MDLTYRESLRPIVAETMLRVAGEVAEEQGSTTAQVLACAAWVSPWAVSEVLIPFYWTTTVYLWPDVLLIPADLFVEVLRQLIQKAS